MAVTEHAEAVKRITRDELKSRLDEKRPMALVEALGPEQFREGHLPGAVNIPPDRVRELAPTLLPDKHQEIVVYCANVACHASGDVARELTRLGYDRVSHYAGGKADWRAAGFPIERP